MSAARLPGSMLPKSLVESERPRTDERRALQQAARRHRGREPPRLVQLGEQIQVRHARQAVRAERDVHARA